MRFYKFSHRFLTWVNFTRVSRSNAKPSRPKHVSIFIKYLKVHYLLHTLKIGDAQKQPSVCRAYTKECRTEEKKKIIDFFRNEWRARLKNFANVRHGCGASVLQPVFRSRVAQNFSYPSPITCTRRCRSVRFTFLYILYTHIIYLQVSVGIDDYYCPSRTILLLATARAWNEMA